MYVCVGAMIASCHLLNKDFFLLRGVNQLILLVFSVTEFTERFEDLNLAQLTKDAFQSH
jgi:hypothetical protein